MIKSALVPEADKRVIDVSEACYDEIRSKLVAAGTGGTIVERGYGVGKVIDAGDFVIRTGYMARHAQHIEPPIVEEKDVF